MPVVQTHASVAIDAAAQETLKAAYGKAITSFPGKSEGWLMCIFDEETPIYFAGDNSEPAAYIEVDIYARSDLNAGACERFTAAVTPVIAQTLGIDPAKIYIRYGYAPNFGWNGRNF